MSRFSGGDSLLKQIEHELCQGGYAFNAERYQMLKKARVSDQQGKRKLVLMALYAFKLSLTATATNKSRLRWEQEGLDCLCRATRMGMHGITKISPEAWSLPARIAWKKLEAQE